MGWDFSHWWGGSRRRKHRRRRRDRDSGGSKKFWTDSKEDQARFEAKNYGTDYVFKKYGREQSYKILQKIEDDTNSPGRSGGRTTTRYVQGVGRVKVGNSKRNAPPKIRPKKYSPKSNLRVGDRFRDGGMVDTVETPTPGDQQPPGYRNMLKLNLENDEELAQGYQHPWAQPTSISSTITGLLRQSQNATANFWDQWALDKGGSYSLDSRGTSAWGVDMNWNPEAPKQQSGQSGGGTFFATADINPRTGGPSYIGRTGDLAQSNPLGAFDTDMIMFGAPRAPADGGTGEPTDPTQPGTGGGGTDDKGEPPPDYTGGAILGDARGPSGGVYNPWGFGSGADENDRGPTPQFMADATMQSLALANAYFAPQRMELAYELGDMETDMRRLAVNLGRQVDDPVLQAKMYKEAMRAVRTLDVQQNTFAFQMAEQRRREELQNFQFYDQLAQEEYKTYLQNRLNEAQLELQGRYYGLQRWNVMNPPQPPTPGGTTATPTPVTPPNDGTTPVAPAGSAGQLIQNQWARSAQYQAPSSIAGIYGNLLQRNPYAR